MQSQEHVIEIEFKDRPSIAHEILKPFEQYSIDKSGLEVLPKRNKMLMAVKFQSPTPNQTKAITTELRQISGVISVTFRDHMPYEEKERQLQTILNLVNEGVIALDSLGIIQHINETACHLFSCSASEITGTRAEILFPPDSPIFETLQTGRSFSNKEQLIRTTTRNIHFFISCSPVLDPNGAIIGVVASIKDYQQAEELTSKVNQKKNIVTFESIIHQSSQMKRLIDTAKIVAKGTSTILLRGESGTGKELFAKAIHRESGRCNAPFVAVNCGALPDSLLESELFGYETGAFTGASKTGKKGLFEQANTGTIFLDEIGEVSRHMQVRLLRVLQEQTVRRISGENDIPINVRIIAATNRNLEEMMKQGLFREDLYYRLNVIPLLIPPLRERKEDIQLIAQHLIRKICNKLGKSEKYLTKESTALLLSIDYPGNIRQLENILELVVNLEQHAEISASLLEDILNPKERHISEEVSRGQELRIPIPSDGNWPPLKELVGEVEKQILLHVMGNNLSSRKAGNILGVSNTTILKKAKKYNIQP